jgi:hypothetical protein
MIENFCVLFPARLITFEVTYSLVVGWFVMGQQEIFVLRVFMIWQSCEEILTLIGLLGVRR